MHQQHGTGQLRRRMNGVGEIDQHVAVLLRILAFLQEVRPGEGIGDLYRHVSAVGLNRHLGVAALHAATTVTKNVIPNHFDTTGRNRERRI